MSSNLERRCDRCHDPGALTGHTIDLGDLAFEGLHLDDTIDSPLEAVQLAIIAVLVSVLLCRLVFGRWDVAWTAGGCLAAIVSLLLYKPKQETGR
jgi:hypothetical protein